MPLIVFECKGIPATRRERIEGLSKPEAGALLPIHSWWSASGHHRPTGLPTVLVCSLWTKIRRLSPNGSGRRSTNGNFVGCLRDSVTDKMCSAV